MGEHQDEVRDNRNCLDCRHLNVRAQHWSSQTPLWVEMVCNKGHWDESRISPEDMGNQVGLDLDSAITCDDYYGPEPKHPPWYKKKRTK